MIFVDNWYIIVAVVAVVVVAATYLINNFIKLPKGQQIAKLKEWLLWAVAQAEKELGSGTGQLKLRYVYDMFLTKFPGLTRYVTFETFSYLVDCALTKFNELLASNEKVKQYIEDTKE